MNASARGRSDEESSLDGESSKAATPRTGSAVRRGPASDDGEDDQDETASSTSVANGKGKGKGKQPPTQPPAKPLGSELEKTSISDTSTDEDGPSLRTAKPSRLVDEPDSEELTSEDEPADEKPASAPGSAKRGRGRPRTVSSGTASSRGGRGGAAKRAVGRPRSESVKSGTSASVPPSGPTARLDSPVASSSASTPRGGPAGSAGPSTQSTLTGAVAASDHSSNSSREAGSRSVSPNKPDRRRKGQGGSRWPSGAPEGVSPESWPTNSTALSDKRRKGNGGGRWPSEGRSPGRSQDASVDGDDGSEPDDDDDLDDADEDGDRRRSGRKPVKREFLEVEMRADAKGKPREKSAKGKRRTPPLALVRTH